MSNILGVSALVDLMNSNKPPNATEDAVLGPLYTENTQICRFKLSCSVALSDPLPQ